MKRRPSIADVRSKVFERDNYCCRICQRDTDVLELAHLKARGMGGSLKRDTTQNTICCCRTCHRGPRSLHSGHVKHTFLSDKGADGEMEFRVLGYLGKAEPWKA